MSRSRPTVNTKGSHFEQNTDRLQSWIQPFSKEVLFVAEVGPITQEAALKSSMVEPA